MTGATRCTPYSNRGESIVKEQRSRRDRGPLRRCFALWERSTGLRKGFILAGLAGVLLLLSLWAASFWEIRRLTRLPVAEKMKTVERDQSSVKDDVSRLSHYRYGCPVRYGRILVGYRDYNVYYLFDIKIPKGFAVLPIDPFTGKAYYYRKNGNSYRLESAGPNGKLELEDLGDDIGYVSTLDFLK